MDLDTALMYFPVFASAGTIAGVIAVSRYPDRSFSVALARLTLLCCTGFMLWLGWMALGGLFGSPVLNWAVVALCAACGAVLGWGAIFSRGEKALWWVEEIRRGF